MSRAVLVTGASRGIGRAIAQAFADAGDRVAVHHGSSPDAAERVAAALPGDGHVVVQADLADAEQVRACVDAAAERLDGLDVLVNNAGVFIAHPPLTTTYEQWQAAWATTLSVNLVGAANAMFCAVPHLVARGGGHRERMPLPRFAARRIRLRRKPRGPRRWRSPRLSRRCRRLTFRANYRAASLSAVVQSVGRP